MASIRELHREAASHGYPKTNCFIRPLSSTTSPTAGMCRTQAPGPDRPPGGLPSGVWYQLGRRGRAKRPGRPGAPALNTAPAVAEKAGLRLRRTGRGRDAKG